MKPAEFDWHGILRPENDPSDERRVLDGFVAGKDGVWHRLYSLNSTDAGYSTCCGQNIGIGFARTSLLAPTGERCSKRQCSS